MDVEDAEPEDDGPHRPDGGPAGDADDGGLGERVAEDALQGGPGNAQAAADEHAEDDAGEAYVPEDGVGAGVEINPHVESRVAEQDREGLGRRDLDRSHPDVGEEHGDEERQHDREQRRGGEPGSVRPPARHLLQRPQPRQRSCPERRHHPPGARSGWNALSSSINTCPVRGPPPAKYWSSKSRMQPSSAAAVCPTPGRFTSPSRPPTD